MFKCPLCGDEENKLIRLCEICQEALFCAECVKMFPMLSKERNEAHSTGDRHRSVELVD